MTSSHPRPGDMIADRYRVESVLGKGGFGTTFAAVDTTGAGRVAVKQLDLRHVEDWKSVELFEREAEVLRRLDHPGIPRYVDFLPIAADRAGLLIQELAPGRSLQAWLDDGRTFDEDEVRRIADQVLEVLEYLGEVRPAVVHRDIKPANLVMAEDGSVRVVDFGAVKDAAARASTIGSTVAGTFGFMAPEVIYGTGEVRSDLYSLGMTLVSLLTGLAPTELPQKRLKPDFRGRVEATQPFLDFVERLTEPVPDDRYPDATHARAALHDAIVAGALDDPGADLGALVAAQDLQRRRAKEEAALVARRRRDRDIAKLARREARVQVAVGEGRKRITFEPKRWRDLLWEQAGWGFAFAFVNPGVFIMMGLGAMYTVGLDLSIGLSALLTVLTWAGLLTGANVAYASARRRRYILDLSDDGHFALHSGNPSQPKLLGRTHELKVRTDAPDPSRLGSVQIEDTRRRVQVDKLSDRDLRAVREALGA